MSRLRTIAPIGQRQAHGFACRADGSCVNEWTENVYPPAPRGKQLRQVRIDCDLGLRAAAAVLRLRAAEISDLEAGRAEFADPAEWQDAYRALRAAAAERIT